MNEGKILSTGRSSVFPTTVRIEYREVRLIDVVA